MPEPYTAAEAAALLGISPRQIRHRAQRAGVGTRAGARLLLFSDADLDRLRLRQPSGWPKGRPRKDP